jgi:hypothetical protein
MLISPGPNSWGFTALQNGIFGPILFGTKHHLLFSIQVKVTGRVHTNMRATKISRLVK